MKRRGFLRTLFGGAVAALLPIPALPVATAAAKPVADAYRHTEYSLVFSVSSDGLAAQRAAALAQSMRETLDHIDANVYNCRFNE